MSRKIELDTDKHSWHPSPLVGQVALVTTVDKEGVENVAPKSWIFMSSFDPPILGLGCNLEHRTAKNILATEEFTVNIPHYTQAEKIWRIADQPHPRRLMDIDLTPLPGLRIRPPRIAECPAHFECILDSYKAWGRGEVYLKLCGESSKNMANPSHPEEPCTSLMSCSYRW